MRAPMGLLLAMLAILAGCGGDTPAPEGTGAGASEVESAEDLGTLEAEIEALNLRLEEGDGDEAAIRAELREKQERLNQRLKEEVGKLGGD